MSWFQFFMTVHVSSVLISLLYFNRLRKELDKEITILSTDAMLLIVILVPIVNTINVSRMIFNDILIKYISYKMKKVLRKAANVVKDLTEEERQMLRDLADDIEDILTEDYER